jgi:hypothetical protein
MKNNVKHLSELIRKANDLINPQTSTDYLSDKELRDRLFQDKPKCFLKLNPIGRDVTPYLIPLCNQAGFEDLKVVTLALKMVQRLITQTPEKFDPAERQRVLNQLNHRFNVLSQTIPKPMSMGAKKAKVTRMFNNIKHHLNTIKNKEM